VCLAKKVKKMKLLGTKINHFLIQTQEIVNYLQLIKADRATCHLVALPEYDILVKR